MKITKGWLLSPLEGDGRRPVQRLQESMLWLGTLSLHSSTAATLSARVTRGPGTGLDLRKELWNVGEERKWASKFEWPLPHLSVVADLDDNQRVGLRVCGGMVFK